MHTLTAREIKKKVREGEISASSVVEHYLNRIQKYDPEIGAFLTVLHQSALHQAHSIDEKRASGRPLGKLAGVPIAIKDNIHVKGELTTCGSKFLTNFKAPFESTVVKLLKAEDAIIIGKTNLDEFAMGSSTENSALKKTSNPWNLKCAPGGSSGGSAAAVAARLCPLALGSDTGGSIRQPASFCGISGFKPTYGRVSRFGLVAFGSSLDQIGPLGYDAADISLIMEVLGRHCEKDSTSLNIPQENYVSELNQPPHALRIGVPWQFIADLQPESRKLFDASLEVYKNQGAQIVEVDLSLLKYSIAVYYILATAEASTNLARFDGIRYGLRSARAKTLEEVYDFSKEEGFGSEVKRRILLGTFVLSAGYQDAYYKKAQKIRRLIIDQYKQAFQKCDLIAMPVSPFPAFEIGAITDPLQMYLADIYTISVNLAGLPGISIPNGFTQDRKPSGLQLIGPQKKDGLVLQAAHEYQKATSYHQVIPAGVK